MKPGIKLISIDSWLMNTFDRLSRMFIVFRGYNEAILK